MSKELIQGNGLFTQWLDHVAEYLTAMGILFKFKLSVFVVFSALMGAGIAAGGLYSFELFLLLLAGGFCITFAANALNQVIEKDTDALMTRTASRPIVTGFFSKEEALLWAGLFAIAGISLLGLINTACSVLGMCSLLSYAFIYTPLKKKSYLSVYVGTIPGALPVIIGFAAVNGMVSQLALIVFAIQVLWQLPHFWAIAWLGHKDYTNAGFLLLPSKGNQKNSEVGYASLLAAIVLGIVCLSLFAFKDFGVFAFGMLFLANCMYISYSWSFYRECTDDTAKKLLFSSFAYLPLVLISLMATA